MEADDPEVQRALKEVFAYAGSQLQAGLSASETEAKLVEKGIEPELARVVVLKLTSARRDALREAGRKNMMYGALWCVGGSVLTAVTYSAAASGGGGYVVTWGAIVFGAIQFFRGVAQSSRAGDRAAAPPR